ncbi:MAG: hypothetical protein HYS13_18375 [Planctomycetia bacterium]|nr:hypothetical protein [Planctomycetia bacterium]
MKTILATDGNFRRLAVVVFLFSVAQMLFPHYQALAADLLGVVDKQRARDMVHWVIVQNIAVGVFSLVVGPLADARGTRFTLRLVLLLGAAAPILAVGLTWIERSWGQSLFWMVFIPLGLTPITLKLLANYVLEISPASAHPRYLSTLALCLFVPFLFSPGVGWLITRLGYTPVFIGAGWLIFLGALLTGILVEPRQKAAIEEALAAEEGV